MAQAGIAGLELAPSHFLVAEGEAELWSSVFRTLSERGQDVSFTHHYTSATTDPGNLAAELAETLRAVRAKMSFRVDPVLPVCVISSSGEPNQIVRDSLGLLAEKLAERPRFRVDWFAIGDAAAEIGRWIALLHRLEVGGGLKGCAVYLLSRQIGNVRLGEPESKQVLARLITLFALTAPSRWDNELAFSRFRSREGFRVRLVGLEVLTVGDVDHAARQIIDHEIWARMWPELSEDVRARARAWVIQRPEDPLTPLLRLAMDSVTLTELAERLERLPGLPREAERYRNLALEICRAVANAENDRNLPAARRSAGALPVEQVFDPEAACAPRIASVVEGVFDEYPFPVMLYTRPLWPDMAGVRTRLQTAHARAVAAIVPEICREFRAWAQAIQGQWLPPNQSERARLTAIAQHLGCKSRASSAKVFTFAAPGLDSDLRDELASLPGSVSHLYALELGGSKVTV